MPHGERGLPVTLHSTSQRHKYIQKSRHHRTTISHQTGIRITTQDTQQSQQALGKQLTHKTGTTRSIYAPVGRAETTTTSAILRASQSTQDSAQRSTDRIINQHSNISCIGIRGQNSPTNSTCHLPNLSALQRCSRRPSLGQISRVFPDNLRGRGIAIPQHSCTIWTAVFAISFGRIRGSPFQPTQPFRHTIRIGISQLGSDEQLLHI